MRHHIAHFLLLALCATILSVPSADAAPLRSPPKIERFRSTVVTNTKQLSKYMSESALETALMAIKEHKCPQDNIAVYKNPKPDRNAIVVTVACYPSLETDQAASRYYAHLEYHLTLLIQGDTVTEVDLSAHGFMYESGRISFITDVDGSDMPEFWLFGAVCECDSEKEDYGAAGCDCRGGTVVEFRNGSLLPWKNRKRVNVR